VGQRVPAVAREASASAVVAAAVTAATVVAVAPGHSSLVAEASQVEYNNRILT